MGAERRGVSGFRRLFLYPPPSRCLLFSGHGNRKPRALKRGFRLPKTSHGAPGPLPTAGSVSQVFPDPFPPCPGCAAPSFPLSLPSPLPPLPFSPSGSSCPGWRLRGTRGLLPRVPRKVQTAAAAGAPGRSRSPASSVSSSIAAAGPGRAGPKWHGQRSSLLLCDPREGSALPEALGASEPRASGSALRGQRREPLCPALSAVLMEARGCPPPPRPTPPAARAPRGRRPHVPPPAAPSPAPRPHAWAGGASRLRPELPMLGIRPKRVFHPAAPAPSRSRPPARAAPRLQVLWPQWPPAQASAEARAPGAARFNCCFRPKKLSALHPQPTMPSRPSPRPTPPGQPGGRAPGRPQQNSSEGPKGCEGQDPG